MQCSIVGLGTALPAGAVAQEDALAMSSEVICDSPKQERLLRTLFRKSGVKTRRTAIPWQTGYEWAKGAHVESDGGSVATAFEVCNGPPTGHRMDLYAKFAPPLAERASRAALDISPVSPQDITHLVTVSCTGFSAPGVDIHLLQSLGLPGSTQRVHVGFMGCHGAINGLRAARGLAAADPDANILMCCVELCSLHYRMTWDAEAMAGNALFADGAAAVVINNQSNNEMHPLTLADTQSCLLPDTTDKMSWMVGDHGFEMRLSGAVPDSIHENLRPWLQAWLAKHDLTLDDVQDWIVHPGGPRILDAVVDSLDLPTDSVTVSREVLSELGNMSSPTVLFVLQRCLAQQAAAGEKRNGPRVLLGFGPGLVAEAALLK
ncbi:type III polyketide synthase [Stieleria varia]|uniref:Alpha-pyrone synthesis polyketide synthase-like Pks18 n=1 Tax=Stieleria varia TaxID=2528005 RepID=A0A5C6AGE1_9BACT|nr:type III polyketide synthase [Stieleria varia]TWT98265.1 Alpha-pyrone synthesis polyketide synthase-like Pks18 [Stieleria varia]